MNVLHAASVMQCSFHSVNAFSVGDMHSHAAPFLYQPSTFQDSISNVVASTAAMSPEQAVSVIFGKYMSTLGEYPLPTKMITGAVLASAGDAIAQGRDDEEYDAARGASFASFDMTYRAAQHWVFPLIVQWCRGQYLLGTMAAVGGSQLVDITSLAAMERSLASQLIIVPFFYYPVFFTFTGLMQGLSFEAGIGRARENIIPLMKRNLLFWIPVQYVQFCYVPTDLQIPFLSCAGLAWTYILSVLAGSAQKYSDDKLGTEDDCVITEDELFPLAFGELPEDNMASDFDQSWKGNRETATGEDSREAVIK